MWPFKPKDKPVAKRTFDAARQTRLVASWAAVTRSINTDLKDGIDAVRARARDLAQNEPMIKKYKSLVAANVIGSTGIVLQARVADGDKQDKLANNAIEASWADWSRVGNCEISGRMSMPDLERAIIKAVAIDGEALIYEHMGSVNDYGYALQLIDVSRLATTLNRDRITDSKGKVLNNAIYMGVEVDQYGKPLNYHIYDDAVGADLKNRTVRVYPAKNIIHLFLADSPEQVRGVSWLHAAMTRIFHLKKYQEWAIIAAGVGASKMGFFTSPEGDGSAMADDIDANTGELYQEAAGGQFGILPEGWGFESFNPDYPHAMFAEFVKAAKRDISSGLNVSYHSLANDLEGVNFSSIRSGTLEEREEWKVIQDWFIGSFMERVYRNWISNAFLNNKIVSVTGTPLPAAKLNKFMAHDFLARRWAWVDPLKDIQASIEAIDNGLSDPYQIAAQQGLDAEDVLDAIKRYQDLIAEKGIELNVYKKNPKLQDTNSFNDVANT